MGGINACLLVGCARQWLRTRLWKRVSCNQKLEPGCRAEGVTKLWTSGAVCINLLGRAGRLGEGAK